MVTKPIMNNNKDTIYALSTPPGKSAIAVVRISGNNAFKIIEKMSTSMPTTPNIARLNKIVDDYNNVIDQTITTYFKKPRSFTGEDMVEISLHGGAAVIKLFIETLKKNKNTRLAEPGEFTRRSFENNKLDLTQVEAIVDLVDAETELQRKQAYNQLKGGLSNETRHIYNNLKNLLANTEAVIDFSDEELPKNLIKIIIEQNKNIIKKISTILKNSDYGKKIRNGHIVAIIGRPNTGKSSFINNISKQDIAIVTDEPGTTRDVLESYIDLKGLPVRFFDTAGIRRSKNKIEKIGINKTKNISKNADLNLIFIDKYSEIKQFKYINNPIFVQSKQDLRKKPIIKSKIQTISSKTNYGINKLLKDIFKQLSNKINFENIYISRERHRLCLSNTKDHLKNAIKQTNYDIFAEDIRLALREISKIYGKVDIEDILDIIFKDFCIGK